MAGNTLGPRARVAYTSDTGDVWNLTTDADLAAASGLPAVTEGTGQRKPSGASLRGVYAQATIGGRLVRKFIPCNATAAFYDTNSSTSITIDGTAFTTTGRKGESYSF